MKELERLQKEKERLAKELRQLENRQKVLLNRYNDAARRARTRRLIEHGAILESVFPGLAGLSGEQVKAFLQSFSRLPGAPQLPDGRPESPDTGTG